MIGFPPLVEGLEAALGPARALFEVAAGFALEMPVVVAGHVEPGKTGAVKLAAEMVEVRERGEADDVAHEHDDVRLRLLGAVERLRERVLRRGPLRHALVVVGVGVVARVMEPEVGVADDEEVDRLLEPGHGHPQRAVAVERERTPRSAFSLPAAARRRATGHRRKREGGPDEVSSVCFHAPHYTKPAASPQEAVRGRRA